MSNRTSKVLDAVTLAATRTGTFPFPLDGRYGFMVVQIDLTAHDTVTRIDFTPKAKWNASAPNVGPIASTAFAAGIGTVTGAVWQRAVSGIEVLPAIMLDIRGMVELDLEVSTPDGVVVDIIDMYVTALVGGPS